MAGSSVANTWGGVGTVRVYSEQCSIQHKLKADSNLHQTGFEVKQNSTISRLKLRQQGNEKWILSLLGLPPTGHRYSDQLPPQLPLRMPESVVSDTVDLSSLPARDSKPSEHLCQMQTDLHNCQAPTEGVLRRLQSVIEFELFCSEA